MKKSNGKIKKKIKSVLLASMFLVMSYGTSVFASGGEPNIVGGTRALIGSAIGIILGFIAIITTVRALQKVVEWQVTSEEQAKMKLKAIGMELAKGAVGLSMSGIVTYVLGFYGG